MGEGTEKDAAPVFLPKPLEKLTPQLCNMEQAYYSGKNFPPRCNQSATCHTTPARDANRRGASAIMVV